MKDKDKIVDLNHYRKEKDFDSDFLEDILGLSDEELDEFFEEFDFSENHFDFTSEELDLGRDEYFRIQRLEAEEAKDYLSWSISNPVGWSNLDERPYLAKKMELAMLYKQNGLYQKALEHLYQIYQVDKNDSLGCRYEILALYVLKSDYELAEAFFNSKPEHEHDMLMQVPLLLGAILNSYDEMAKEILDDLETKMNGFVDFCQQAHFPMEKIVEAGALEKYKPNSMESFYIAWYQILPLLVTAHSYVQAYLNDYYGEASKLLKNLDCLSAAQMKILSDYGLEDIADLEEWTEDDLLDLPKFGKVTIQKLKEAGVEFYQE